MARSSHLHRMLLFMVLAIATAACAAGDPTILQGAAVGVAGDVAVTTTTPTVASTVAATSSTTTTTLPPETGLVTVPVSGLALYLEPGDAEPELVAAPGLLLPVVGRQGEWIEVVTTCDPTRWARADDVTIVPPAAPIGAPPVDLADVVLVLDAGHGDRDWGGVGPSGTAEKHVNLDIAERLQALLERANRVDWETGAVGAATAATGDAYPAAAAVWLTRDRSGPNEGEYELGLAYRAAVANAAGAHAFVSIHNNTVPKIDTTGPGTEVFYAISSPGSDRLAGLIYEELIRSFSAFRADWRGGSVLGARNRLDPDTQTDYYGVLRRAEMPAVIVEGVYISEPEEEALLRTEAFRQAYAEGVYRGIVRYFTTTDRPDDGVVHDPEPFPDDAGTVNTSRCRVPEATP